MVVGHAGNVSIVKIGTVLEIVEHTHVPMPIFLSGLTELCIKNEILHFDSLDQGDVVRRTNLVLILALAKVLDETDPSFATPFPDPFVGCNKLTEGLLALEILLVNQLVILWDGKLSLSRLGEKRDHRQTEQSVRKAKDCNSVHLDSFGSG